MASFQELCNNYSKIEIPDYQRDYVQGRDNFESEKILRIFLNDIYSFVTSENKIFHIDYIYGKIQENKFIPVDGQQRLTTLYLLHLYILPETSYSFLHSNYKSKFTYELRTSSKDFCNFLVSKEMCSLLKNFKESNQPKKSLSSLIRNHSKFRSNWERDATVKSMLSALEMIKEIFSENKNINLTRLNGIQFDLLNLGNYKFQKDIFLKMNSRGLALTEFEVVKARIEEFIELQPEFEEQAYEYKGNTLCTKDYFAIKIDNEWADFFCTLITSSIGDLYDEYFLRFIKFICSIVLLKKDENSNYINYDKIDVSLHLSIDLIKALIKIFDTILIQDRSFISNEYSFYFNENESLLRITNINTNDILSQRDYLLQFSYYNYILLEDNNKDYNANARLFSNLIKNSEYINKENKKNYVKFSNSIKNILLIQSRSEIYKNILQEKISGFSELQIFEEKQKIPLLKSSSKDLDWEKEILRFEKNPYFNGQIFFLFNFIGFDTSKYGSVEFIKFQDLGNKVSKLIKLNENGFIDIKDNLLERALLSFGNYLIYPSGKIRGYYSFLYDGNIEYQDHLLPTWKKYLSWDFYFSRDPKTKYLNELLNHEKFNIENLETSLIEIINEKSENIKDWRLLFIREPRIFNYFETLRYIEIRDNLIILTQNKMNPKIFLYIYYTFIILQDTKFKPELKYNKYEITNKYSIHFIDDKHQNVSITSDLEKQLLKIRKNQDLKEIRTIDVIHFLSSLETELKEFLKEN